MENIKCNACGGELNRVGNYNVCKFCGNKWIIDAGDDVHVVDRANAWAALRDNDFERAVELFENIIMKDPESHEAYWGMALSLHGIIYVTDLNERKKVPTCNNISEYSFLNDKQVQKAISLAPADIASTYKKQAEEIERIRIEWLGKARKEPPYDVFISFKDSDREHDIERTQDSIDAQDLYNALVSEGYKVFFSRISLKDKVSEHYEPYIYNAIKTAKVMIVFGEKPEYFSSVWIKNEWSRFKTRIEKGEKHKNSLVIAYKNMNPGDLPVVLRSRQCLNASDMTFLPDLTRHIKRVIEESKQAAHLERITVQGGQMSKKARKISNESIQTREIGATEVAETSISEKQRLAIVKSYIKGDQWEDALKLVDEILLNAPNDAEAILLRHIINRRVHNASELLKYVATTSFSEDDRSRLEKILNYASKEYAEELLDLIFASESFMPENVYLIILQTILPYNYSKRDTRIKELFLSSIKRSRYSIFEILLSTLKSEDVDAYIEYCFSYAKQTENTDHKSACIDRIIEVDSGNLPALRMRLDLEWSTASAANLSKTFEEILKYCSDINGEIVDVLNKICENPLTAELSDFSKQILKYYAGKLEELSNVLQTLAYSMINAKFFEDAQYILNLILTFDSENAAVYWGLCLIRIHASSEKEIIQSNILLKYQSEYIKYLTLVDEDRRQVCIKLADQQEKRRSQKRRKKRKAVILSFVALLTVAAAFVLIKWVIPDLMFSKANELMAANKYDEALKLYDMLGDYSFSEQRVTVINGIKEIDNSNFEEGINTLLSAGVPVKLTYGMGGGDFSGTEHLYIPQKNTDPGVMHLSASVPFDLMPLSSSEDIPETIEFTYTSLADFAGIQTPAKDGYSFVEWKLDTYTYQVGETFEVKLDAVWATKAYTVEYDLAGGSVSGKNAVEYDCEDEAFTLINPTRKGYTFTGWLGTDLSELTMEVTVPAGSYGNRAYSATWKANEYFLIYDANGGNPLYDMITVVFDSEVTLATVEREGYTFVGWYYGTDKVESGPWKFDHDVPLKAEWIPDTDTKYVVNHHHQNKDDEGYTIYESETLTGTTGTDVTPTVNIYTGFTSPNEQTVTIAPDGSLVVDYYYDRKTHTVRFVSNGGNEMDSIMGKYDTSLSFAVPEKAGYTFGGWFADISLTQPFTAMPDEDITLYAYWTEETKPSDLSYSMDIDEVHLFTYMGSGDTLCIPSHIGGLPVTTIAGSAFEGQTGLKVVVIPNTVKIIGKDSFAKCVNLESLTIPFVGNTEVSDTYIGCLFGASRYNNNESYVPVSLKTVVVTSASIIDKYAFYKCPYITNITLPNSLTSIGESAFYYCSGLSSINIPDGVITIGSYVFYGCSGLKNITVGSGVMSIGSRAFMNCDNIENVYVSDISKWCTISFYDDTANPMHYASKFYVNGSEISEVNFNENITFIGKYALYNIKSIKKIVVPDTVTSIGANAFMGCSNLESLTVPVLGESGNKYSHLGFLFGASSYSQNNSNVPNKLKSVVITGGTSIISNAFYGCSNITSITLPSTLKTIESNAFSGCSSLETIIISSGVTSIGSNAFSGCSSLKNITIPSSVTSIASGAFSGCSGLVNVYAGDISAWCKISFGNEYSNPMHFASKFYVDGKEVTEVIFEDGATYVSDYALYNIGSIKKIVVPNTVTVIGKSAFKGCNAVESLTIPFVGSNINSNTYLGYLFGATSYSQNEDFVPISLKTVVVTGGTNLGSYAFSGCSNIANIILPNTLTSISNYAFKNCSGLESITIPENVTSIGTDAFNNCTALSEVHVNNISKWCKIEFGNVFANPMHYAAKFYVNGEEPDEVIFEEGTTSVGLYILYNIKSIKKIVVPDTVRTIGQGAFMGCSKLESLTIPFVGGSHTANKNIVHLFGSVANIPTSLKTIVITSATSIDSNAFSGCNNVTSITLPSTLTSIGAYAFQNCSGLTSITIPDGVTSIGSNAFSGCTALSKVYVNDISKWYRISFANDAANPMHYATEFYVKGEKITEVTFDDQITAIPSYALYNIKSIKKIVVPNTVITINQAAFKGCDALESLTVPFVGTSANQNTIFGAIFGTTSTNNVADYVPARLKTLILTSGAYLPNNAFYGCANVTSIILPGTLKTIGTNAFYNCASLTSITIPDGVTTIGSNAFSGCNALSKVYVNDISKWYRISFANDAANPMHYATEFYVKGEKITEVTFDDQITTIPSYALYNIKSIKKIVVPNTVTTIKLSAFKGCDGLESLTVPFVGGSSNSNTYIGYLFGSSNHNQNKTYVPSSLKAVIITNVTSISDFAFEYCEDITSITLSSNMNKIGSYAFRNCSALTNIHFGGTTEQWEDIKKGTYWDNNISTYTVHCSDGDIVK